MTTYLIFYTIRTGNPWRPIYDRLKAWQATHADGSIWLYASGLSAATIEALLLPDLSFGDALAIIPIEKSLNFETHNTPGGVFTALLNNYS